MSNITYTSNLKSIYHIQLDYLQLMDEIENNEGELTPELEQRLTITQNDLEDKCVNYGYLIRQFDHDIEQVKAEVSRLNKIAESKSKLQEQLKTRISDAMLGFKILKVQKNNLTLSFRRSEQLIVDQDAYVPAAFITTKEVETIDKKALKEAIKAGQEFEGIYIHENQNLQIK